MRILWRSLVLLLVPCFIGSACLAGRPLQDSATPGATPAQVRAALYGVYAHFADGDGQVRNRQARSSDSD